VCARARARMYVCMYVCYKYVLNDLNYNLIEFLRLVKKGKRKEIEDEVNKMREEVLKSENDMQEAKTNYFNHVIYSVIYIVN
jgi:hypothetical protein